MSNDEILQEIHDEFINSKDYEKFLWEINNVNPGSEENSQNT